MINKMQENNKIYIPVNFAKGVIPAYHIYNIDFSEDTPSGGGTTHALNVVVFQPINVSPTPKIELDLHTPIPSRIRLNDNTFGVLKECRKPSLKDFIRPISCLSREWLHSLPFDFLRVWLFARGMEFFFSNGGKDIWGDISAMSDMALYINRPKVSRMDCETIEVETCSVDEILDDIEILYVVQPIVTEQFNQCTSCNDDVGTAVHDLPAKEQNIFERPCQTLSSSSDELRICFECRNWGKSVNRYFHYSPHTRTSI